MTYNEYKEIIGIDEIASLLGYKHDPKAGLRYRRYILTGENQETIDSFYISNYADKSKQTYWRHSRIGGGDLISFIEENINKFRSTGRNKTDRINNILKELVERHRTLNENPSNNYKLTKQTVNKENYAENIETSCIDKNWHKGTLKGTASESIYNFDNSRYECIEPGKDIRSCYQIMRDRAFDENTMKLFAKVTRYIRDKQNTHSFIWNIGFPYINPLNPTKIEGYEIRGYKGYKGKAAGTDSKEALWVADFSAGERENIEYVCFAESAYDAMAFYQLNREKINLKRTVFCSTGGSFSDSQIRNTMTAYKNAKAVDCFDRDINGQISGIKLIALMEGIEIYIKNYMDNTIFEWGENSLNMKTEEIEVRLFKKMSHIKTKRVLYGKVEDPYKDWNEKLISEAEKKG